MDEYAMPGWGGRTPVAWVGARPSRRPDDPARRRPVVAVLDTGVGTHPWFTEGVRGPAMVLDLTLQDPEITGVTVDRYGGELDDDAGHGTFITGIIRQISPDADVLPIRIMAGDGVVPESDVLQALALLAVRQQLAVTAGNGDGVVDVVCLSLGYYHEQPADAAFDPLLLDPITALGAAGVAVVVAAGNDATDLPMFPAAFTPWPGGPITTADPGCVPVISVGAYNPDGKTVALFSNAGPWVACHRVGAAIVSTFPTSFDASEEASEAVTVDGLPRATIDPDDFAGGFGTWSGTSFAAPVLAAEIARSLSGVDLTDLSSAAAVKRARTALEQCGVPTP
jgi:subtilisin family serine protease